MDAPVFERTRLSFARNLEGMNKSDLARHAGVSPAAVTQWESGVKTPSSENVKRITQILNVPPTFFTPGEHGDPVTPQTMHYTSNPIYRRYVAHLRRFPGPKPTRYPRRPRGEGQHDPGAGSRASPKGLERPNK